ncbi:hypothetical protein WDU94_003181 [Cyamophila willieti]
MSWFDTSNIVSLAKSTLKEAQKTIDKALDITDEPDDDVKPSSDVSASKVASEPSTPFASSSIWGSFTGSFFEPQSPESNTDNSGDSQSITKQPDVTSTLHESFSLIKQRTNPVGNKNKHPKLSKSFDQPPKKSGKSERKAKEDVKDDDTNKEKNKNSEKIDNECQDKFNKEKDKLISQENVKTEEINAVKNNENNHSLDRKHVGEGSTRLKSDVNTTVDRDNKGSDDVDDSSNAKDINSKSSSKQDKDFSSSSSSQNKTGMSKEIPQETIDSILSSSDETKTIRER